MMRQKKFIFLVMHLVPMQPRSNGSSQPSFGGCFPHLHCHHRQVILELVTAS